MIESVQTVNRRIILCFASVGFSAVLFNYFSCLPNFSLSQAKQGTSFWWSLKYHFPRKRQLPLLAHWQLKNTSSQVTHTWIYIQNSWSRSDGFWSFACLPQSTFTWYMKCKRMKIIQERQMIPVSYLVKKNFPLLSYKTTNDPTSWKLFVEFSSIFIPEDSSTFPIGKGQ